MNKTLLCFILSTLIAVWYLKKSVWIHSHVNEVKCYDDLIHNTSICNIVCPFGSFALPGMLSCHPWLNCGTEIALLSLISSSVVKTVYLADWKGYRVVFSVLSSKIYEDDFKHNVFMIKSLFPSELVVQLLGFCENALLTRYYELGNALNIHYHLKRSLRKFDNIKTRLNLCVSYASIIKFLHNSPVGGRVMCDSNTLEKTLSQYLLTDDLRLVVNDLDATPLVDFSKGGIHCGNRELIGDFIAPEQVWPYPDKEFDIDYMPLYNEKTDIFKLPDVCNWFLGNNSGADVIKYKLFKLHKTCKSIYPFDRPNIDNVIKTYKNMYDLL